MADCCVDGEAALRVCLDAFCAELCVRLHHEQDAARTINASTNRNRDVKAGQSGRREGAHRQPTFTGVLPRTNQRCVLNSASSMTGLSGSGSVSHGAPSSLWPYFRIFDSGV